MSSTNKKNKIELLAKIKQLFNSMPTTQEAPAPAPAPAPATPMVMKTVDGVDVSMDKMEVGGKCMINGVAAPANTYVFEDGSSVTTDAEGVITMVTPKAVTAPAPAPEQTQQQSTPVATQMSKAKFKFGEDIKKAEDIETLFASFATGTPEERISNLELVAKALMEYSFGWEIRQAKEKQDRDAAIAIYTGQLATAQTQLASQKELIGTMLEFVEEFVSAPAGDPPVTEKRKFTFGKNEVKGKGLAKFQEAARKLQEEKSATIQN